MSLAISFGEAFSIAIKRPEGNIVKVNGVARFDGLVWQDIGNDTNKLEGTINDMACWDDRLILGGDFYLSGELALKHLAYWQDAKWHTLEIPEKEDVDKVFVFQKDLYLLTSVGEDAYCYRSSRLYRRQDNKWLRIELSAIGATYSRPLIIRNKLVFMVSPCSGNNSAYFCWDGQKISKYDEWDVLRGPGDDGIGQVSWAVEKDNKLYVGGGFIIGTYDHPLAKDIACYDGTQWAPLRDGNNYCGKEGAVIGDYLYTALNLRWSFQKQEWQKLGVSSDANWAERSMTANHNNRFILGDDNLLVGDGVNYIALPYTKSEKLEESIVGPNHSGIGVTICADSNSVYLAGANSVFQPFSKKELEQRAVEEKARKAAADDLKKQQEAEDLKKTLALQAEADRVAAEKEKDEDIKLHQIPPTLHSAGEPSYLDTVTYINNCLKQSGKFLYFDPKRNKVVVTYAQDCSAIFDLADFDPKATEYTTKTVKIYCTDRKAKVSYVCGDNTINTSSFVEFECADFGSASVSEPQAERLARAFAHLIELFGGKRSLF